MRTTNSTTKNKRRRMIVQMLNAGHRAIDIAESLSLTRERIRQIIRDEVPLWLLHIPCQLCGKEMEPKRGLNHKYHKACTTLVYQRGPDGRPRGAEKTYHQRREPDGHFEEIALEEYKQRGYNILWMPMQCEFDYVVNGMRVDVKGSHLGKNKLWQFGLAAGKANNYDCRNGHYPKSTDMNDRCDIIHCIGEIGDSYQHYFIPAFFIGELTSITIKPSAPEQYRKWLPFKDRWKLLERET